MDVKLEFYHGYIMMSQDYDVVAISPEDIEQMIRRLQYIREGMI